MPTVSVYNLSGEAVGEMSLSDEVFGQQPNEAVLHQATVAALAARRQGTASTRSRGEVEGSGRKLYRQKGTGRARAGDRRSPTRKGGGIAHGPKPRDYRQSLPKKMKRLALKSALSAKLASEELTLLDELKLEEISARHLARTLEAFRPSGSVLLAVEEPDRNLLLSARNLPGVEVIAARNLDPYRVLACRRLLLTRAGAAALEATVR